MTEPKAQVTRIESLAQHVHGASWRLELLHSAPQPRLIWITQGQGRVILGARRRGVGTHNLLHLPAREPVSLTGGPQLRGHLVTFGESGGPRLPIQAQLIRTRNVHAQGELQAILEALGREQMADRPMRAQAMAAQSALLAIWLHRHGRAEAEREANTGSATDRLIAAYLAEIERHHASGRSMADHAEALDVSPTHLSRTCKQALGVTAADLLTDRLVHAARVRIEDGRESFGSIADALGFGSAAYFSRFVQTHTGHSPRALRQLAHGSGKPGAPAAGAFPLRRVVTPIGSGAQ